MTELTRRITELSPQKRALLLQRLHGRGTPAPSSIRPRDPEQSELPLSFAQQRLWFLDQLEPGSPLYNIPVATRFEGRLDVEALRRALEEIVRRHEALRTALRVEAGRPLQVVAPAVRLELPVTDLLALPDAERDAHALRLAAEEAIRAMVICYDLKTLESYMDEAVDVSQDRPILIDKFLEDAFEVDVDTLADGQDVVIGGIMEHIEEAGIHSGDSSCALPTYLVKTEHLDTMRRYTRTLAKALNVVGLMNVQYAIKDDVVYVLEVNPRASRTVPFVSKATGVPLAKVAARLMTGKKLADFNLADELPVKNFFVKSPVFPFAKFPGVDTILGPEMKSTGEVMGVSDNFGQAYAKAQMSAGVHLPRSGTAFISVNQHDKKNVIRIADRLHQLGFKLVATRGTATALEQSGIPVESVYKVNEGRPHIVDMIKSGKVDLILNTPLGKSSFFDERAIRRAAMQHGVPCITTLSGGAAVASGIAALQRNKVDVLALQEYHEIVKNGG